MKNVLFKTRRLEEFSSKNNSKCFFCGEKISSYLFPSNRQWNTKKIGDIQKCLAYRITNTTNENYFNNNFLD